MRSPDLKIGKVLIVIPNYNGKDCIQACLESVSKQTYQPLEIIVIDNASQDGSGQWIQKNFPKIRLIQNQINAGWSLACNLGAKASPSEYVMVLNNDAAISPTCVEEMVKAIEQNPRYGSCACRILLKDRPQCAEVCGLVIYRDGSSCARGRLGPSEQYMTVEEVFAASGCCSLFRRAMIDEIGLYDPDFFMYCDDSDLGWRQQATGWKCIYTPHAIAYHAHSQSAGSYSALKAFHVERNRLLLCIKHFSIPHLILSFLFAVYRYGYQIYLSGVLQKGALAQYRKEHSLWQGLGVLLKAYVAAFAMFPVTWRKRREIRKLRGKIPLDTGELFRRFGISTRQMAGYE